MLFASVILVICVFEDIQFESALLRAGISFLCTYSIGIIALTLFKVTVKTEKNKNAREGQHEAITQPENAAAKA